MVRKLGCLTALAVIAVGLSATQATAASSKCVLVYAISGKVPTGKTIKVVRGHGIYRQDMYRVSGKSVRMCFSRHHHSFIRIHTWTHLSYQAPGKLVGCVSGYKLRDGKCIKDMSSGTITVQPPVTGGVAPVTQPPTGGIPPVVIDDPHI